MNISTQSGLIFQPIQLSDAHYFFEELSGIDTFLSINAPTTLHEAEELVKGYLTEIQKGKEVRFIIKNTEDRFVGCVGLYNIGTDDTEIQLWIAKNFQHKGYGFEIAKTFLAWAQKNIEFTTIYAAFDKDNSASQQLAKKLGGHPGLLDPKPVFQPESGKTLQIIWYEFYKDKDLDLSSK